MSETQTMTCIEITETGGPEVLKPATRPVPAPGPGEVLIEVAAAGVNRPDVIQRQGHYASPPGVTDIPGLEIAGRVTAVGPRVETPAVGDAVCALVAGGGYAEYCTAPALQCLAVPEGLDMVRAAALPETFFTVWSNVFERAGLRPGETLMVHGGSSGIGTTAIQMASRLGSRVIATAGSAEKCAACIDLGAERAVNYHHEDFVEAAREATGGAGVDVILDMVGGDYVARNLKALARDGRLVNIAFLKGSKVGGQPDAGDAQAADPHRIDPASPVGGAQGRDRPGAQGAHLAAHRKRRNQAGDCRHLPPGWGRRCPPADGKQPAHRQDRAGDFVKSPSPPCP